MDKKDPSRIISIAPDVMGGTPVFAGTRVPVQTFLDYMEAGDTIDDFLEGFPTVTREQLIAFLEQEPRISRIYANELKIRVDS